jgi:hypothetical protein
MSIDDIAALPIRSLATRGAATSTSGSSTVSYRTPPPGGAAVEGSPTPEASTEEVGGA